ncbi:hypothetical protein CMQ_696 [Grosmannia clavigera kw1407]|uniref:Uncharacterized protein n=1 Tax=Grosmannia clavigera (strain kw1407 / UAMH 11150) TaxID=655863 RepID=F0XF79_GROCL|nr:uncharacterized protein CMQ_696 [Grosmannia clavigera kw1407]EFX03768.1 hypothetical protein CMQ_696 [Grosmannia clavigera kw1407]
MASTSKPTRGLKTTLKSKKESARKINADSTPAEKHEGEDQDQPPPYKPTGTLLKKDRDTKTSGLQSARLEAMEKAIEAVILATIDGAPDDLREPMARNTSIAIGMFATTLAYLGSGKHGRKFVKKTIKAVSRSKKDMQMDYDRRSTPPSFFERLRRLGHSVKKSGRLDNERNISLSYSAMALLPVREASRTAVTATFVELITDISADLFDSPFPRLTADTYYAYSATAPNAVTGLDPINFISLIFRRVRFTAIGNAA